MNEKKIKEKYEKRFDFQQKMIARQSQQIEDLKLQNEKLKLELQEKDDVINSVSSLRNELSQNVAEIKKGKERYNALIEELKMMKSIMNKEVYKNRWWLVKLLLK